MHVPYCACSIDWLICFVRYYMVTIRPVVIAHLALDVISKKVAYLMSHKTFFGTSTNIQILRLKRN